MSSVSDCELLLTQSNRLFDDRGSLLSYWQEVAENFYVEKADFTRTRVVGEDFANNLTTSAPLNAHSELTNIISTILRPQDKPWLNVSVRDYDDRSEEAKIFLQRSSHILRNAMYDKDSMFARAAKEADADLAAFGNAVISCEMNWKKEAFLFRSWHLRDVVWCERDDTSVGRVDRKWEPTAELLNMKFRGNVHANVKKKLEKDRYSAVNMRHTFIDSDMYMDGYKKRKKKYVSIFYDADNKFIVEEVETDTPYYAIPRWKTVSGSQYAYSPSVVQSLADARLIQDMMLVILEAGQKAVTPPMISVGEAVSGEPNLYAGGITHVDADYDERLGEVLRPISQNNSAIPLGIDMMQRVEAAINEAHFITKIGLPPLGGGMSPYEVNQRVGDYLRKAMPLLDPLESEWNGGLCELAFEVGMANGLFVRKDLIPKDLLGSDIEFTFTNPLRDTADRAKGNMLSEATGVIAQMSSLDPSVGYILDAEGATRDTLDGIGAPREWFRQSDEVEQMKAAAAEKEQMQNLMATVQQGAEAAQGVGDAAQSLEQIRGA